MKKKILALAIGGVLSAGAYADINDILISEYVEGSGSNKAIEISNLGSSDYTFDASVSLYNTSYKNQVQRADGSSVLDGVTIPSGKSIVVINGEAGPDIRQHIIRNGGESALLIAGTYDEVKYNALSFNGDDAIWLGTSQDEADIHDIFAVYGQKGINDWKDKTFRRKASNTAPSKTFNVSDWDEAEKDSFGGLGDPSKVNDSPLEELEPITIDCGELTAIPAIQGDGTTSPLKGEVVNVEGIVTQVTKLPVKGLYLQAINSDGNTNTSDAIFVKTSKASTELVGKTICFSSEVQENYGLTQLETSDWGVTDESSSVPAATDLVMIPEDNGSFSAMLERYEGMLVNLPADIDPDSDGEQDMRVTKAFGFDYNSYRNNLILAYKRPNMVPTQDHVAGSQEADDYAAQNNDYRLIIESSEEAANGQIPYYPDFATNPTKNYIRIDDSVIGMQGVISYSYGDFNLVVSNTLDNSNFKHNTDRTKSPALDTTTEDGHFAIKIGTQNLLNLFNSPFGGDYNTHGENRGADSDEEFQKQKTKLVAAIKGLDADIVGLMEIENNGFGSGSAIKELVDAINDEYYDEDPKDSEKSNSTSNRYVFIGYDANGDLVLDELDSLGGDAISTGLLYRPTKVSIESMKVIPMPSQHAPAIVNDSNITMKDGNGALLESGDNYQRDTLTATFIVNNTSKRLTVAVNHFKSKGSTCWEEWQDVEFGEEVTWKKDAPNADYQGSCENFRVAAAVQLADELAKIGGDSIIVGDLNAYAQEDPLLVLTENSTGKTITTARDTFIGKKPQFNVAGTPVVIAKSYGYINTISVKDAEKGHASWSYSYNDEIGSLDHILITPSLESRLIDAVDWHINAAESSLYDYNSKYKSTTYGENPFYEDDAYRSSDHDSAIISLSYQYAEVSNGQAVQLVINNGLIKVPYTILATEEGAKAGDIAQITLSAREDDLDMQDIILPSITLTEDGQTLVLMEVHGVDAGAYSATMTLKRDDQVISDFTRSINIAVAKQDSTTPKIAAPAPYDGSGGSLGIFGIMSLLGFGFLRRRKAK